MRGEELANRILDFAVRIVKLCNYLEKDSSVKYIRNQLIRSGTSVGANYEEARGAESDADFIHKLSIALKEIRETIYWLELIRRSEILPEKRINDLATEAGEICAILITSIKTVKSKK
ncbi:MAG: four helix bundle protein [FCB group bacterium]|nr:four helix bundle protein [FCB group bacterium]